MRIKPPVEDKDITVIDIDDVIRQISEGFKKRGELDKVLAGEVEIEWGKNGWNALLQFKPQAQEGFTYLGYKHYKHEN